jgi:hypothetical protein
LEPGKIRVGYEHIGVLDLRTLTHSPVFENPHRIARHLGAIQARADFGAERRNLANAAPLYHRSGESYKAENQAERSRRLGYQPR